MTLQHWNKLDEKAALEALLEVCHCQRWAKDVLRGRPYESLEKVRESAEKLWQRASKNDIQEAFKGHPRIGQKTANPWAKKEQGGMDAAALELQEKMRIGNGEFERKFGHVFLTCATGKSAEEMYTELQRRMKNHPELELEEAKLEQGKITLLRLEKLFT